MMERARNSRTVVPINTDFADEDLADDEDNLGCLEEKADQPNSPNGSAFGDDAMDGRRSPPLVHSPRNKQDATSRRMRVYMKAPRLVFRDHQQPILTASVISSKYKSDTLLLSGGEDKLVKVWSLSRGALVATLEGHVQRVSGVVGFTADGFPTLAISASWDDTLRIWHLDALFNISNTTAATATTAARNTAAVGTSTATASLSPSQQQQQQQALKVQRSIVDKCVVLRGHKNRVYCVTTLLQGPRGLPIVASGSADNTIRTWALPSGAPLQVLEDHTAFTWNLCITSWCIADRPKRPFHGPVLISGCKNNTVCVWQLLAGTIATVESTTTDAAIAYAAAAAGTDVVAVTAADSTAPFVAATASEEIDVQDRPSSNGIINRIHEKNVSSDIGSNSNGSNSNGSNKLTIRGHNSAVQSISAFEYEEQPMLITACRDKDLRVWSMLTGELVKVLKGHTSTVSSVFAFNTTKHHPHHLPNHQLQQHEQQQQEQRKSQQQQHRHQHGVVIVSSSASGSIRGWKYTTGEVLRIFNGHTDEVNAVTAFASPEPDKDDVVVVSGSRDCTLRSWLLADEKSLRVLPHHDESDGSRVRVNCLEVYAATDDCVIVTGGDDGRLRNWCVSRSDDDDGLDTLVYCADTHSTPIVAMGLYIPPFLSHNNSGSNSNNNTNGTHPHVHPQMQLQPHILLKATAVSGFKPYPQYLHDSLVITGGRNGYIAVSDLHTGEPLAVAGGGSSGFQAHDCVLTALAVCSGFRSAAATTATTAGSGRNPHVDPFVVTGGEDNFVKVWSLVDFALLHQLESHIFDVTSVAFFLPKPIFKPEKKLVEQAASTATAKVLANKKSFAIMRRRSNGLLTDAATAASAGVGGTATGAGGEAGIGGGGSKFKLLSPIIISGSMDNTVHLWSYASGKILGVLEGGSVHITSVAAIELSAGPVVAAGDGAGVVRLWSLNAPFSQLATLSGHSDEVRALHLFNPEGVNPILVSGSLDSTMRVWDLQTMKEVRTMEGHKSDITALRVFSPGGSDTSVASASTDATVRVMFNFLGNLANLDVVHQLFRFDFDGKNNHLLHSSAAAGGLGTGTASGVGADSSWPRIAQMAAREGPERFFGLYYDLFGIALREGRPDFLAEFLPQSQIGLLKSNNELEDGDANDGRGGLLRQAIELRDSVSTRTIVSCWCCYLSTPPSPENEAIYDKNFGQIAMQDLILLAETFPREFERLICSLKMLPVRNNQMTEAGVRFLYEENHITKMDVFHLPARGEEKSHFSSSSRLLLLNTQSEKVDAALAEATKNARASVSRNRRRSESSSSNSNSRYSRNNRRSRYHATASADNSDTNEHKHSSDNGNSNNNRNNNSMTAAMFRALTLRSFAPSSSRSRRTSATTASAAAPVRRKSLQESVLAMSDLGVGVVTKGVDLLEGKGINSSGIGSSNSQRKRHQTYFFLPLQNAVQMDMLRAYTQTCQSLDSVEIFKSEAGSTALAFAWRAYGRRNHVASMTVYCLYVFIATTSTLTFQRTRTEAPMLAVALIAVQLLFDVYSTVKECHQVTANPLEYFVDVWNYIDLTVIVGGLSANAIRLYHFQDTQVSRILLSVTSIFSWFGILYFLRAFESTGPLVSMILQISKDIRFLILCMMIVLVGFSQAFWLLSDENHDLPFGTFQSSLFYSYVFLLGQYDPNAFDGLTNSALAVALSTVYTLIVSILLLNLLIALMGDSYGSVKGKGLAQWKLEQALIITEMEGSLSAADRYCQDVVYFRRNTDDLRTDGDDTNGSSLLHNSVMSITAVSGNSSRISSSSGGSISIGDSRRSGIAGIGNGVDVGAGFNRQEPHLLHASNDPAIRELQRQALKMQKEQNDLAQMVRESTARLETAIREVHLAVTAATALSNSSKIAATMTLSAATTFDERDADDATLMSYTDATGTEEGAVQQLESGSLRLTSMKSNFDSGAGAGASPSLQPQQQQQKQKQQWH